MKACVIILGAGASPDGNQPFGVQQVTLGRRILDWQIDAFAALKPDIHFVGGYDIALVQQHFPTLTYHHNRQWRETGSVASLALALEEITSSGDLYIVYADILLRPALIQALADASAAYYSVACDRLSAQQTRIPEMIGDSEFIGLVRVPFALVDTFRNEVLRVAAASPRAHLSRLFTLLPYATIDAHSLWAHAEFGRLIARFVMGSKAATLERLQSRLNHSSILPLSYFSRMQYQSHTDTIIAEILQQFAAANCLIVRSSAVDEDGFRKANAGKYYSELNVALNKQALHLAIDKVFASYSDTEAADEVLVQPQLRDVAASGVVFTRTLENGAPYYVIHYALGSDTTAITAGTHSKHIKKYIARCAPESVIAALPVRIQNILRAVREIEQCVCHDALDIEFALDSKDAITTLQVRPLMIDDAHQDRGMDVQVEQALANVVEKHRSHHRTIWSVMADWNPAEIIGVTPAPLALDLYRRIITDTIWAQQRYEVGYCDLRHTPLMYNFAGHAFVDVRASLNSFIPATLAKKQVNGLVRAALEQLQAHREWHDKVEFELLPTCLDFDFAKWQLRYPHIDAVSWEDGLRIVTRNIIMRTANDIGSAKALEMQCATLETPTHPLSEWVKQTLGYTAKGALIFAHLARAGFVAASLLRSAMNKQILSAERCATLMESIEGVGHLFTNAAADVRLGLMTRADFIARFGHLRPGTYDIAIPAYRAAPKRYLDPVIASAKKVQPEAFAWTKNETATLDAALKKLDIGLDAHSMLEFIKKAVAGREYAKFVFTRLLSAVLDRLELQGKLLGITANRLPAMPLDLWLDNASSERIVKETEMRHRNHRLTGRMMLPPVIIASDEIYAFEMPPSDPSFITTRKARAYLSIVKLDDIATREMVEGKIVAIIHADPGFDYLFSLGICGLITAYGGPNSHMAIRACEYGIPAVIGIGENAFSHLRHGARVELDGAQRRWGMEAI